MTPKDKRRPRLVFPKRVDRVNKRAKKTKNSIKGMAAKMSGSIK